MAFPGTCLLRLGPSVASQEEGDGATANRPAGDGILVRSDLGVDFPVNTVEFDALEAFLMPQILMLLQEKQPTS